MIDLPDVNVKQLRRSMNMSQTVFAYTFGIPLCDVRNWEQGRREPGTSANTVLHLIRMDPNYMANFVARKRAEITNLEINQNNGT
jgi:DNA-binding transcriptional regulator YiaG